MDFDAYEYLEKTVEENEERDSKRHNKSREGSERSYRKRDVDDNDPTLADGEDRKSKRSRGDDENVSSKRERSSHRDKDRHHRDSEREKDRERGRERERSGREKEKERERRERDKEKEREREREREKERERKEREDRERSRRSRSRSDRDRERERDLEMRESRESLRTLQRVAVGNGAGWHQRLAFWRIAVARCGIAAELKLLFILDGLGIEMKGFLPCCHRLEAAVMLWQRN